ncbi:MAG: ECF-type sigma factor [Planctomycetota bacterium]
MSEEITELLRRIADGDAGATGELTPLVYDQLRQIASNVLAGEDVKRFDATEMVHEAYLRLLSGSEVSFQDRTHFFASAATVIRRVLVDEARKRRTLKRGGNASRVELDFVGMTDQHHNIELLTLDQALKELAELSPRQATLVELRFFGGLTQEEAARSLGISRRTVAGDWAMARAWLQRKLNELS